MEKGILLASFYLAPVAYFSHILRAEGEIVVEKQENFQKQSYRNRAAIHSANGLLNLTVPVVKSKFERRTLIKDVKISYDEDWQRMHWMTLQSAYRRSAYFEFYEDYFEDFYKLKHEFLFDYNQELNEMILGLLKIKKTFSFTDVYQESYPDLLDLREEIHPKKLVESNKPYFQVFEPKNGFISNLSIVDLLFNQGPHSKNYL